MPKIQFVIENDILPDGTVQTALNHPNDLVQAMVMLHKAQALILQEIAKRGAILKDKPDEKDRVLIPGRDFQINGKPN